MGNINWLTVLLLAISNFVMLYAWYGHLRSTANSSLFAAIILSWGVAFFEYLFMIPANRIGSKTMSLEQLKILQEIITLLMFMPFAIFVMKQSISWNYLAASVCIAMAAYFIFR
jgi:uncharacterized protein (DUF486 family)